MNLKDQRNATISLVRILLPVPSGFLAMFVAATAIAIGMRSIVAAMLGPFIRKRPGWAWTSGVVG